MNTALREIALLWDIDGTLLNTKGVAAKQLMEAFKAVIGTDCTITPGQYSGFTDYEIVLDLLQKANMHPDISMAEEILFQYGTNLLERLLKSPPELLAETQMVFEELERLPSVKNYIGSGNSKLGAYAKIKASGLEKFFEPNSFFISTPEEISRDSVIKKAALSIKVPILLIGDSDRDISSAKNNCLKVLAVATGHHKVDVLRSLNPDYLLHETWKVNEFLEIISAFRLSINY